MMGTNARLVVAPFSPITTTFAEVQAVSHFTRYRSPNHAHENGVEPACFD